MTEAEVARELHAILAQVRKGTEVVIEEDDLPVAIIHSPVHKRRLLSECIALAEARGTSAILDEGFLRDVEAGIGERSQPWNPPSWE
jgi:antitoxin (DNA-binding transcriptional repressor) of toxin-antitoxin stability system